VTVDTTATMTDLEKAYPGWRVWRSVNQDGRPSWWVASRMTAEAGPSETVMEPTADALEAALQEQRRLREERARQLTLLGGLRWRLGEVGFHQVQMEGAVLPRLMVHAAGGVRVEVRVVEGGSEFIWDFWGHSGVRRPVSDAAGVVRALAAFVAGVDGPVGGAR
jgi:hypothetical protein